MLPVDPSVVSTRDASGHVAVMLEPADELEAGEGEDVLVAAVPQAVSKRAESPVVTPARSAT